MKTRIFIPSSQWIMNTHLKTRVKHWVWKKGNGLFVKYTDMDGVFKSEQTLKELLKEEKVIEITNGYIIPKVSIKC